MRRDKNNKPITVIFALGLSTALAGCMGEGTLAEATRGAFSAVKPAPQVPEGSPALAGGTGAVGEMAHSEMITGLLARQSVLSGSSFTQVSNAVLAANSRAAESELRAAKLRAEAASKNWLPTLGPSLSLTSLSELVAGLVVDQVLFANGRKKAEREFAKADVEVAAVILAEDTNQRVATALDLYITAEEARAQSAASAAVAAQMGEFAHIMRRRVAGGVSGPADLQLIEQKLAEIQATQAADARTADTALAELNAMSLRPLGDVRGLGRVGAANAKSLEVLKAEAERERAVAEATVARSRFLPTVTASSGITTDGVTSGINVGSENGFGFGTKASLEAIEAAREGAQRQVAQADEDSARVMRRLEAQLAAIQSQQANTGVLLEKADANLQLLDRQYQAGLRPVMDVVGAYESKARLEREMISFDYRAAATRVEMARVAGVLVDGADI